ncbi:aldolase catalytic domain-containing protein [Pontiellaceae bacterium B1224]|nr:aldolase catalytic domain-containing protein [Pontiellaceae bacterium B1224]
MSEAIDKSAGWVTFDPNLKIIDCTVRDGGLCNAHKFKDGFFKGVYDSCVAGGIDYMEVGYKADKKLFPGDANGPWKFSSEEDIRRELGENDSSLKLCAMADTGRTNLDDILPKSESVLDMIRVATYIHQIPAALKIVKDAKDKGYEVALNLMAVSTVPDFELDNGLEAVANVEEIDYLYVVDSFGSLYYEQIADLIERYAETGKTLGIHAHNNQQLAYANTIYAAINGVKMLDTTMMGMGRGAGNCPTELLVGFLKNPKFNLRPILDFVQNTMYPLSQEVDWGYSIPYMITGHQNEHPRAAIALRDGERKDDYVGFYDEITAI